MKNKEYVCCVSDTFGDLIFLNLVIGEKYELIDESEDDYYLNDHNHDYQFNGIKKMFIKI